ncbi:YqzH family protein [Halalkalibacterium ligniniphilum]|uniref:YqzH family protein n=1 Tax=Halalkalibacterium ligniniphilum TaxID=1134413 RepID=UPI00034D9BFC|nr:YqzH family protein [Halalkalibacterium ligniniphilum]
MDQRFLLKKIERIVASYTNDTMIPITEQEQEGLITTILTQVQAETNEELEETIHDVCYSYFFSEQDRV